MKPSTHHKPRPGRSPLKNPSSIECAAFFSDYKHEVLEFTNEHRVTLTYNLFWIAYGSASMADHFDVFDSESLHVFAALRELLECPTFLPNGESMHDAVA